MKFKKNKFISSLLTIILFASLAFIHSCKTKARDIIGKYTTANINLLDALLLKRKFGGDFTYQLAMVIDLKKDSTFQIGFCQRKIVFDGKWKTNGDYVQLYDVYNYYLGRPVDSFVLYREPKENLIFFPNKTKRTINGRDSIIITYTVLKINGKGFDGNLNKGFLEPKVSKYKN
jgi:hypothetical protein